MTVPAGPFIGFGADFGDSVNGTTYTTVGHIVDIDGPDPDVGDADASYLQMANAWKLFIAKLIDGKEAAFKIIWSEAAYAHIMGLLRTPYFFQITCPDLGATATTVKFQGYYKGCSLPIKMEDMMVSEVKIKVSGIVTITAGT